MNQETFLAAQAIMKERFGKDSLIALATVDGSSPAVRTVNSYYEDGCFYIITHALSNKIRQLKENPQAAICGDWFTAHGTGQVIGHPRDEKHKALMETLRSAFADWYDNGHTDESDPNTCILQIQLTDGILFSHGTRYEIDFTANQASC